MILDERPVIDRLTDKVGDAISEAYWKLDSAVSDLDYNIERGAIETLAEAKVYLKEIEAAISELEELLPMIGVDV